MDDTNKRIKLIKAYLDDGCSLWYAKLKADKDLQISSRKNGSIVNTIEYQVLKQNYLKKFRYERSFHKCIY